MVEYSVVIYDWYMYYNIIHIYEIGYDIWNKSLIGIIYKTT